MDTLFDTSEYVMKTRPLYIINTSKKNYLDECVDELLREFDEFSLNLTEEEFVEFYFQIRDTVKSTKVMNGNDQPRASFVDLESIFNEHSDVEYDQDDEDCEDYVSFIDNLDFYCFKYYQDLYLEWLGKDLVIIPQGTLVCYNKTYYKVRFYDHKIQRYMLRNNSDVTYVNYEHSNEIKVVSKWRSVVFLIFSKTFIKAIKNFWRVGFKAFNDTLDDYLLR
jgi:hypothetical protein